MIGDTIARTAFTDQIMAALAIRAMTARELADEVDVFYCCCEGCQGRARRTCPEDLWPLLMSLTRTHAIVGIIEPGDGNGFDVRWRRMAGPAAVLDC